MASITLPNERDLGTPEGDRQLLEALRQITAALNALESQIGRR